MMTRRAVVLAIALTSLALPMAQVQAQHLAGGGYAVLRYRFTPGEHLIYHFLLYLNERADLSSAGNLGSNSGLAGLLGNGSSQTGSATVDEHVISVSATGVATVAETASQIQFTQTSQGKTQTQTQPTTTTIAQIAPDGSLRGHSANSIESFFQDIVTLPSGPVRPGAQWTSTTSFSTLTTFAQSFAQGFKMQAPSLSTTSQNVFTGYKQAGGEIVADITSTAGVTHTSAAENGLSIEWAAVQTGHLLFGLESSAAVLQDSHQQLTITLRGTDASGQQRSFALIVKVDVTLQKQ